MGTFDLAQTTVDRAEHGADLTAEQRQNTDNNNSDEHQNKRVLDQTLAIFLGEEATKHCIHPLPLRDLCMETPVVYRVGAIGSIGE